MAERPIKPQAFKETNHDVAPLTVMDAMTGPFIIHIRPTLFVEVFQHLEEKELTEKDFQSYISFIVNHKIRNATEFSYSDDIFFFFHLSLKMPLSY